MERSTLFLSNYSILVISRLPGNPLNYKIGFSAYDVLSVSKGPLVILTTPAILSFCSFFFSL